MWSHSLAHAPYHFFSVLCVFNLVFCHLFRSQTPLPTRGRNLRLLTSATRLKSAVWWTLTPRTLLWTKVRLEQPCADTAAWLLSVPQCHNRTMLWHAGAAFMTIQKKHRIVTHTCEFTIHTRAKRSLYQSLPPSPQYLLLAPVDEQWPSITCVCLANDDCLWSL